MLKTEKFNVEEIPLQIDVVAVEFVRGIGRLKIKLLL